MKKRLTTLRPSGEVLPLRLRMKYNEQQVQAASASEELPKAQLQLSPAQDKEMLNRIFTVEELEQRMKQASTAMMEIQRQLFRGEEVYMEETHAHGNLFRGWDNFIDLKDVGVHNTGMAPQPGSSRRLPNDNRWFSGSCTSLAQSGYNHRPLSRMSSRASTPSMLRSTSVTPISMVPSPPVAALEASDSVAEPQTQHNPVQDPTDFDIAAKSVEADAPSSSFVGSLVTITSEPQQDLDVKEESTPVKTDEDQVLPNAATPPRRGSTRKRKQGES